MGGRGGMGGRSGSGGRGGGPGGPLQMLSPGETLEIETTDTEIHLRGAQGQLRIVRPDGEKRTRSGPDGSKLETRSKWEAGVLVVESKGGQEMKITERYTVAPGGQLVVTVRLENSRFKEPVLIRTYYDPKQEADTPPPPNETGPQGPGIR